MFFALALAIIEFIGWILVEFSVNQCKPKKTKEVNWNIFVYLQMWKGGHKYKNIKKAWYWVEPPSRKVSGFIFFKLW